MQSFLLVLNRRTMVVLSPAFMDYAGCSSDFLYIHFYIVFPVTFDDAGKMMRLVLE